MKKLLALLLLSPLAVAQVPNNTTDFSLSCKVTGQVLIKTEDGVSTTYSNYTDGLEVGDTFPINFTYSSRPDYYRLSINADALSIYVTASSFYVSGANSGLKYILNDDSTTIGLYEDDLEVRSVFGDMNLRRYYKNDYELMHTEGGAIGVVRRTLTANCMNMPSEYEKVLLLIKSKESDKWDNYSSPFDK